MEHEGSLPHSQELATCPYPEPQTNPVHTLLHHFIKLHFNIILLPMPCLPEDRSGHGPIVGTILASEGTEENHKNPIRVSGLQNQNSRNTQHDCSTSGPRRAVDTALTNVILDLISFRLWPLYTLERSRNTNTRFRGDGEEKTACLWRQSNPGPPGQSGSCLPLVSFLILVLSFDFPTQRADRCRQEERGVTSMKEGNRLRKLCERRNIVLGHGVGPLHGGRDRYRLLE